MLMEMLSYITDCSNPTSLLLPDSISGGYNVRKGVIQEKSQFDLFLAETSTILNTSLTKLLVCSLSAVLHNMLALWRPVMCMSTLTPSFPAAFCVPKIIKMWRTLQIIKQPIFKQQSHKKMMTKIICHCILIINHISSIMLFIYFKY